MKGPLIAGVDEVGRGPLAGPVIACAVILAEPLEGLMDSKKLTASRREAWVEHLQTHAMSFAYGRAEVEEIDELNIHYATLLAMKRAIEGLSIQPDWVEVDGKFFPDIQYSGRAVVGGDATIPVISAASILAKVSRDAEMTALARTYPDYAFERHKGYPTPLHRALLRQFGPCPIHRRSYRPVAELSKAFDG